jgi:hypothetical protein
VFVFHIGVSKKETSLRPSATLSVPDLRDETVFGVRILDATQIHVDAAVARLISEKN